MFGSCIAVRMALNLYCTAVCMGVTGKPCTSQCTNAIVLTPETFSEPIVFNAPSTKPVNKRVVESIVFNAPSVQSPQIDSSASTTDANRPSVSS